MRRTITLPNACAIFKAYLVLNPQTTPEGLRDAFPCKGINAYYWEKNYAELFYPR